MKALASARRAAVGAEVALMFAAGAMSFATVTVALTTADSDLVAGLVGAVAVAVVAVLAIAGFCGAANAIPVAIGVLVAYDWFQFPPTHPHTFPGRSNLLSLFAYLAVGSLGGGLASYAVRRAEHSEAARSELAEEQAALRRVATLVAEHVPAEELFAAVAHEVGALFRADYSGIIRYDDASTVRTVATWAASGRHPPVPERWPLQPGDAAWMVAETQKPTRVEDWASVAGPIAAVVRDELGVRSSVGCPIVVEGRLWGALAIHSRASTPLPPDTETRIAQFTDLVATAIANADARTKVERLVEEHAALRRVATLIAEGAPPSAVFDVAAAEVERLLQTDQVALSRYEADDDSTIVASRGATASVAPLGAHANHPIVVDGRRWGVISATWNDQKSPPPGTEHRLAKFAQLLDIAIANADSRDQLTASRARLLTAADEARRHVVRDLHDGAQQRLVHSIISLRLAQQALNGNDPQVAALVGEALEQAEQGNTELRELARGILPTVLTRGGLRAAVESVVARLDLPVDVDVADSRLPAEIEATAYFIVVEALTNAVKHAHATRGSVTATGRDGLLKIVVSDDGIGGADPDGHGLVGLADRAAALGGRLTITSPPGGGTLVAATVPLSPG